MNKYIVAYISQFDNVLQQVMVEADSEVDAAYNYLAKYEDILFLDSERQETFEEVSETVFNMDGNISVYAL